MSRFVQSLVVLVNVTVVVFLLVRIVPGDPARLMLGMNASEEMVHRTREELGLDRPLYIQYTAFMARLLQGDLGQSVRFRRPVTALIAERFPASLELTLSAVLLALLTALPAGIYAAVYQGGSIDRLLMLAATIGQSMPIFWLGIMLITVFSVKLGWLPTSGRGSLAQLVMPSVTLATYVIALLARLTRASMVEVLGEQYIRTARAKGLREIIIIHKHAFKTALLPVVTVLGLQVGALLGGAVITETVFNWPGIGTLAVEAIYQRDYPVVQGVVLVSAVVFVVLNLLVDLSYRFLDPRLRSL